MDKINDEKWLNDEIDKELENISLSDAKDDNQINQKENYDENEISYSESQSMKAFLEKSRKIYYSITNQNDDNVEDKDIGNNENNETYEILKNLKINYSDEINDIMDNSADQHKEKYDETNFQQNNLQNKNQRLIEQCNIENNILETSYEKNNKILNDEITIIKNDARQMKIDVFCNKMKLKTCANIIIRFLKNSVISIKSKKEKLKMDIKQEIKNTDENDNQLNNCTENNQSINPNKLYELEEITIASNKNKNNEKIHNDMKNKKAEYLSNLKILKIQEINKDFISLDNNGNVSYVSIKKIENNQDNEEKFQISSDLNTHCIKDKYSNKNIRKDEIKCTSTVKPVNNNSINDLKNLEKSTFKVENFIDSLFDKEKIYKPKEEIKMEIQNETKMSKITKNSIKSDISKIVNSFVKRKDYILDKSLNVCKLDKIDKKNEYLKDNVNLKNENEKFENIKNIEKCDKFRIIKNSKDLVNSTNDEKCDKIKKDEEIKSFAIIKKNFKDVQVKKIEKCEKGQIRLNKCQNIDMKNNQEISRNDDVKIIVKCVELEQIKDSSLDDNFKPVTLKGLSCTQDKKENLPNLKNTINKKNDNINNNSIHQNLKKTNENKLECGEKINKNLLNSDISNFKKLRSEYLKFQKNAILYMKLKRRKKYNINQDLKFSKYYNNLNENSNDTDFDKTVKLLKNIIEIENVDKININLKILIKNNILLQNISILRINNCKIESFFFDVVYSNLVELDLKNNKLKSVYLKTLVKKLNHIDLSNNMVESLDFCKSDHVNFEFKILNLCKNRICEFDLLSNDERTFNFYKCILYLNVDENSIQSVECYDKVSDSINYNCTKKIMPFLVYLSLKGNFLTSSKSIFQFSRLLYVDLSYNEIETIDSMQQFNIINTINMSGNILKKVDIDSNMCSICFLKYLKFNHNSKFV
ncbi:hypothetical protein A3Q56_00026 [Intoshia linei]|uniref:Leucine-rich repeat protein n=1 Tax=Intoshia linei TaxID=1819745 RepID=A0A177BDC0_9BILA|nr:hypothetical protein A3Q56_00026 [Intoshia linei]